LEQDFEMFIQELIKIGDVHRLIVLDENEWTDCEDGEDEEPDDGTGYLKFDVSLEKISDSSHSLEKISDSSHSLEKKEDYLVTIVATDDEYHYACETVYHTSSFSYDDVELLVHAFNVERTDRPKEQKLDDLLRRIFAYTPSEGEGAGAINGKFEDYIKELIDSGKMEGGLIIANSDNSYVQSFGVDIERRKDSNIYDVHIGYTEEMSMYFDNFRGSTTYDADTNTIDMTATMREKVWGWENPIKGIISEFFLGNR
jgi:hypothetical protein